jgi:hypothetical protein
VDGFSYVAAWSRQAASVIQSRPFSSGDSDSAFLDELVRVACQVEQGLWEAGLAGVDRAEARRAIDDEAIAVLR